MAFHLYDLDTHSKIARILLPAGVWLPSHRSQRHGFIYATFNEANRWARPFLYLDVMGLAIAASFEPSTALGCKIQIASMGTTHIIMALVLAWRRPFRCLALSCLRVVARLLEGSFLLIMLNDGNTSVVFYLLQAVMVVEGGVAIGILIWETCYMQDFEKEVQKKAAILSQVSQSLLSPTNIGKKIVGQF